MAAESRPVASASWSADEVEALWSRPVSAVAQALGVGVIPVRKKGKLPFETISTTYALEYGTDTLEMHVDALAPGDRVLVVDDVLAPGGTAEAVVRLVQKARGDAVGLAFVIEMEFPSVTFPSVNFEQCHR